MKAVVLIVLAGFALGLAGCGKKADEAAAEKAVKTMTGGKVDIDNDGQTVTIKGEGGEATITTGDAAKIPADFPKDVLVYSGAKVMSTLTVPDGKQIVLQTKDTAAAVATAYKEKMKAEGWTEAMSMNMGETAMVSFKKEDRNVTVQITSENKLTTIALTLTVSK